MEKLRLEMDFLDGANKKYRIRVDEPREDLDKTEIQEAMENIIQYNIFKSKEEDLVGIDSARFVRTTVEEFEI